MQMPLEHSAKEFDSAVNDLSKMPEVLELIAKNFKDKLRLKLFDGSFSILEHICHLRDLEREGYSIRVQKLLTEAHPQLPDFDGDKIAAERNYNQQDPLTVLTDFKKARQQNVAILKSLTPRQLENSGELEGIGAITLEGLMCLMLQHDENHLKELGELTKHFSRKNQSNN
jgi:hypothetical protein